MNLQTKPLSPWLSIWFKPRNTIKHILDTNSEKYVLLLAALSGIYRTLERATNISLGDIMSFIPLLLVCLIAGAILGVLGLYIGGRFFSWIGRSLGGQATSQEVRTAIAWSSVPDIVLLAIYIPIILIFGHNWFISSLEWMSPILTVIIFITLTPIGIILLIWRFFLFIKCLAEAHQFSAWKSLGTVVIGTIIIVVPALIFSLISR